MRHRLSQFYARLHVRLERARKEGLWLAGGQLLDLLASAAVWVVLLPVSVALHLAGFRRLTVLVGRIGHLAAEPDSFLKARALGMVGPGRYFMLAPVNAVANATMLDYWRPHIRIIEDSFVCWIVGAMSRWVVMKHDMSRYVLKLDASQDIYRINAAWAGRAPLLSLAGTDKEWSDRKFAELGLPDGAWYVCIHVREPGFSPADEAAHSYRNSDPQAVMAAMNEIVRRGGWCVRMGDPSMTPLKPVKGVIDYAHHPLRSARMDILLCARARFFLGNTSGLTLVSSVFGVPSALANLVPLSVLAFLPTDIGIPKLVRSIREHRILSFGEIMGTAVGDYRYTRLYAEAGLEVIENSPEEICELAVEMIERLNGQHVQDIEEDARQARFMALFRPGHYAYGSAARVGSDFLRRYADLLS